MSTLKRKRSTSSNSNSNSNNNTVTRILETPKKSKKRIIEVRMYIDDYNSYKDYKKYMKENNIDIPSGQSEYSQRLANLDIEHKKLIQLYNILEKRYKDLIKNCLEEKKVNRYGKRKKTIHTRKNNRGENETNNFFYPGINDIPIGNSTV